MALVTIFVVRAPLALPDAGLKNHLFVTGAASDGEIRASLERTGQPWLEKPVSSAALLGLLTELVAGVSAGSAASR